jgi:hypothetical protein
LDYVTFQLVDGIVKLSIQLVADAGVIAAVASSRIIGVRANNDQQTATPPSGITTREFFFMVS